jgi:hypothetical protein
MRNPVRRCGALAIAVLLVVGHAAGMQAIAWMGMFIERVQTQSVGDAIVSTFDGSRPCGLCQAAQAFAAAEAHADQDPGKAPAKQDPAPALKWMVESPYQAPTGDGPGRPLAAPLCRMPAAGCCRQPPTPPPRA